jgi:hypothetical protein
VNLVNITFTLKHQRTIELLSNMYIRFETKLRFKNSSLNKGIFAAMGDAMRCEANGHDEFG